MITILGEQDAEKYWNLRLEALQHNPEAFLVSYEEAKSRVNPIAETAERLSSEESITFGAFEGEELVGMTTLLFSNRNKIKHKASIVAMYVSKDHRQKGIGRQLMFKAVSTARRLGYIEQILLEVVSTNKPAKNLYEAIGFQKYGTEPRALKVEEKYFDEDLMVMFL